MTTSAERDLTEKLETSSLQSASSSKEAADLIKTQANEAFKSTIHSLSNRHDLLLHSLDSDYEKAIELYTKALELHPDAILYSNRSFAYLRREWYGYALIDAKKALEYDPKYIKVFHFSH